MRRIALAAVVLMAMGLSRNSEAIWSLKEDRWEVPLNKVQSEGRKTLSLWPDRGIDFIEVSLPSRKVRDKLSIVLQYLTERDAKMVLSFSILRNPRFDLGRRFYEGSFLWMAREAKAEEITIVESDGTELPLSALVDALQTPSRFGCGLSLFD